MKIIQLSLVLFCQLGLAQVTLTADGPGNTYELINSVLAPGYNVVEAPDCAHTDFGRHIEEVWDAELNKYVFKFHIHVTPDDDRCLKSDRQRNEIKTYNQSPANLIGTYGEKVVYKWKFKLDSGFQASNKFTHIHQIKAYGGPHEDIPVVSLITRGGSSPKLQVMHSDSITSVEKASANLALFKGVWVEATETITYGESGKYQIVLKKVSDGTVLLTYTNNNIRMWRDDAQGIRPKWGIYRSLLSASQLRDEALLYADFSIEEVATSLKNKTGAVDKLLFPNPVKNILNLGHNETYETIAISDVQGKMVWQKENYQSNAIDVSGLEAGMYVLQFKTATTAVSEKFIKTK